MSAVDERAVLEEKLSQREQAIFIYLIAGYTNRDIAENQKISVDYVKTLAGSIYKKAGVSGRTELAGLFGNGTRLSINKDAYAGLWFSRFTYTRADESMGCQFDLESIRKTPDGYEGTNLFAVTDSHKYLHSLEFQVQGRVIRGTWENSNTDNMGVFQLRSNSTYNTMTGMHLGHDDLLTIRHGQWDWLKLDVVESQIKTILHNEDDWLSKLKRLAPGLFDAFFLADKSITLDHFEIHE